jgi:tRNA (guanine37-N1)-methyltransferase
VEIPAVLTSGNHGAIGKWRREEALRLTRERRPDLLDQPVTK